MVNTGTVHELSAAVRASYDAPFPDKTYQAGARAFRSWCRPHPDDPAHRPTAAWKALPLEASAVRVFGAHDAISGRPTAR